jgi:uncharacterized protein DUF2749
MKWSIVISVLIAVAAVGGGAYYIVYQREIRVEGTTGQPAAERAREDIGTYKDAKHPSFPGPEKKD